MEAVFTWWPHVIVQEMVLVTVTRETICIFFLGLALALFCLERGLFQMACFRLQLNGSLHNPRFQSFYRLCFFLPLPDTWISLAGYMKDDEVLNGIIYPSISSIRDITKEVAAAVVREAVAEDLAEGYREMDPRELQKLTPEETMTYVKKNMWDPAYPTVVYRKE
ncbi:NAD-dependent malic enzyme 65 kDa isoform, mitochondrial-like isoform X2 [Zingiber officinale]|nr:NAD-dependent malic enzyme 65 kDa isoform, mitochondrial-like isoform X2 [Zingiber officinale]XP_042462184.1 NAD-dependent malic enzyme 65 kDa isoform, mitochondrial-like isoform X2 [Zingiber officinale]XP_042462185.1 NAD-dependent malic enzyme 65 kDa isoform, mitochondrial-like isoform X2 [Zingiber officinale]